jgi:hypothetical protein
VRDDGSVKVSVVRGGGVSGLVTVTTVDSQTLSADDAKTLARMVDEADAFNAPDVTATHGAGPDEFQVSVTFEDATRNRTVTAAEHDLPSRLRSLVDWVSSAPGRTEEVGPPGTL